MAFTNPATNSTALSKDAELKAKSQEKENLVESVVDLGKKIEEAQSQLKTHTDLTEQCETLGVEVKNLEDKKRHLGAIITQLEKDKVEAQINVNSEYEKLKEFEGLDGKIQKATEDIALVEHKLEEARSAAAKEKARADETLHGIVQEIEKLEKVKITLEGKIPVLKAEIKTTQKNKDLLEKDVEGLGVQEKSIQKKVDAVNKKLTDIKSELHNLELKKADTEEILDKLRIEFDKQVDEHNKSYDEKLADLEKREGAMSEREQWVQDNLKYLKKMKGNYERATGNKLRMNIEDK